MLRVAGILNESIVDGPGIRAVVFFQGCPRHFRAARATAKAAITHPRCRLKAARNIRRRIWRRML